MAYITDQKGYIMKRIFIILCLFLCACDNSDKNKSDFEKMIDNMAKHDYQECVKYASQEFKNIDVTEHKKTCKCVIDYIYSDESPDAGNGDIPDRFAIDFRAFLKDKCGNNIPEYTLRDIPEK